MLAEPLPRYLDLRKLTNREADICGEIALDQLPRLVEFSNNSTEKLEVALRFFRNDEGCFRISGKLSCRVWLTCQRCLQLFQCRIEPSVELQVVWNEEAMEQLLPGVEPWLATEDSVELIPLLEEEILLALPLVALHDVCLPPETLSPTNDEVSDKKDKVNPFSVLAELKKWQD